jgi:hypothetical protein
MMSAEKATTGGGQGEQPIPFAKYSDVVVAGDLAKLLVKRGVLSVEDFKMLVQTRYMEPRLRAMNEANWQATRDDLMHFLNEGLGTEQAASGTDRPGSKPAPCPLPSKA